MATQTVTTGSRTTHGAQSNLIPTLFVDKMLARLTGSAAGFTFVARLKKNKPIGTLQPKVGEDLLLKQWTTVQTAYNAAATSIVVAAGTGQYIASRDVIVNKTAGGGVHIVVSVSTDTLTVSPNVDNGTSTAGAVGDELMVLGPYIEQGGPYPQAKTVTEVQRTFYIFTHSTSINFTREARNSDSFFNPRDYPYQKAKRFFIEHVLLRDLKAVWGGLGRAVSMPGTVANYTPAGVANQIQVGFGFIKWMESLADADHNVTDTDLTEAEFIKRLRFAFFAEAEPQHTDTGMLFHAPELAEGMVLWNIGRTRFDARMAGGKSPALGLTWTDWKSPFGPVRMKAMEHLSARVAGGLHKYFFNDTKHVSWQPYKNQDTSIELDVVKDGYRRTIDVISETGCAIFKQPNSHLLGEFVTTS